MSWPTVALGELCEINVGKTPSRANKSYWANGTEPWLSIADMTKGFLVTETKERITKEAAKSCNCKLAATGTVLMSFKLSVGKVSLATFPLYTNEAIAALPVKNKSLLCEEYLVHALKSIDLYSGTDRAAMGLTLNKDKLKRIPIPLPPLAQQKRIAAILDKATEIKAKREQAIAKLDELAQSTFVEMFGDAALNAENWEVLRLDELVEDGDTINYGVVQPGDDVDVGVPLLRVGDLVSRDFSIASLKKITPSIESQYKRSRIKGNEILISCVGTIGTVVTATADMVGFNIARAIARVPVSNKINKVYLENYLRSKYVQRYFLAELRTVSQPTLNIKQICETKVMCPPIHMQEEYELRVRKIASNLASASNSKLKLDGLIASLQHQAFTTGFDA